mgnify:CR=1 FL=1
MTLDNAPEQARELLDIANRSETDGQRPVTVAASHAPLAEAAPALAHLAANMHYEYAVQNAETGAWLREESNGVVVHTSDPLAADWGTDLEEAKSYAVWITGEKLTEYRVMARLATAPEVVE